MRLVLTWDAGWVSNVTPWGTPSRRRMVSEKEVAIALKEPKDTASSRGTLEDPGRSPRKELTLRGHRQRASCPASSLSADAGGLANGEPGQELGTALYRSQIYPHLGGRTNPSAQACWFWICWKHSFPAKERKNSNSRRRPRQRLCPTKKIYWLTAMGRGLGGMLVNGEVSLDKTEQGGSF